MRSITSRPLPASLRNPQAVIEPSGKTIAAATSSRSGVFGFTLSSSGTRLRIICLPPANPAHARGVERFVSYNLMVATPLERTIRRATIHTGRDHDLGGSWSRPAAGNWRVRTPYSHFFFILPRIGASLQCLTSHPYRGSEVKHRSEALSLPAHCPAS